MLKKISTNKLEKIKDSIDIKIVIKDKFLEEFGILENSKFKLKSLKGDIVSIIVSEGNLASEIMLKKSKLIKNINKSLIKKIKDIRIKIESI